MQIHPKKLSHVMFVMCFFLTGSALADVGALYQQSCATCHASGALNAPKMGDKATWQKLITQKGMSQLVKSTRQGMPQMPAMGLCQTCTDKDFEALIEHMAGR